MYAASPTPPAFPPQRSARHACAPGDLPQPHLSETIRTVATLLRWDVVLRAKSFRYLRVLDRLAVGNPWA